MATNNPNDGRMAARRHELFADMMALVLRQLQAHGTAATEATLIASDLADRLADHWGGQNITFPKEYRRKLSRIEIEIYDAFLGYNGPEVAQKYGISERGLRKLVARVKKRIAAGRQGGLFDPSAG
jgi:Mor family transcriptional regulator